MGLADEIGTLEVGKLADILVVNADITQDISALEDQANITAVMQGGIIKAGTMLTAAS